MNILLAFQNHSYIISITLRDLSESDFGRDTIVFKIQENILRIFGRLISSSTPFSLFNSTKRVGFTFSRITSPLLSYFLRKKMGRVFLNEKIK